MTTMQGTVTTSHEFFKKSKKEYRNWEEAIFREAIQNSYDAGAKNIDITISTPDKQKTNLVTVSVRDDGKGMTQDILLNVLLTMGGSCKENNNIGGFGYAKSILFFAHQNYLIHSQDNIVQGIGGQYTFSKSDNFLKGTLFVIEVELSKYDSEYDLIAALKRIVSHSTLKTNITCNGEKLKFNSKKYSYTLSSKIGNIQFSESNSSQCSLWVRVNGLAMFSHEIYFSREEGVAFEGYIELNGSPLEMLTANRDSLRHPFFDDLNTIFDKLKNERKKYNFEGHFNFIINAKAQEQIDYENFDNQLEKVKNIATIEHNQKLNYEPKVENHVSEQSIQLFKKFQKDYSKEKDKYETFFNEFLSSLSDSAYPINFMVSTQKDSVHTIKHYKQYASCLLKKKTTKIAITWDTIVRTILTLSDFKNSFKSSNFTYDFSNIYIGFIFGDQHLLGSNSYFNDHYHIGVNPLNKEVDLSFEGLLDLAIHECTHFLNRNHGDGFVFSEYVLRKHIREEIHIPSLKKIVKQKTIGL